MPKTNTTSAPLRVLAEEFDILLAAPGGVQEMRELILQLAVQGKLVEQNPEDEPASELLERIEAEKAKLVKDGAIKKTKPAANLDESEAPYGLPGSWAWTRLDSIGIVNPRNNIGDDVPVSFIPMSMVPLEYGEQVSFEARPWRDVKSGFTHLADEDVAVAKITPCFENGKAAVMRNLVNGVGAGTTELHVFRRFGDTMLPEYVLVFLKSAGFREGGVHNMTGSAGQKRVPKNYFAETPFPLAPLKEQKRIVTKVTQLMAFCDDLEARQQKVREDRVRVHDASIDRLLSALHADEFAGHWQRICDNFDRFYDDPASLTKLRQAIVELAVQGKLVTQDPNDGPATKLLERIEAEKETLVKEGRAKSPKPLSPVEKAEMPFRIPRSWAWVRLGQLLSELKYGTSKRCDYGQDGHPVLRIPNVSSGTVDLSDLKSTELSDDEISALGLRAGDILIIRSNGSLSLVGRATLVGSEVAGCAYAAYLIRLRLILGPQMAAYTQLASTSGHVRRQIEGPIRTTTGVKNVNTTEISNLTFPLPPLQEQKRMVAKVERLMSLCDTLEGRLDSSRTASEKLLKSVIHQVANASPDAS